MVGLRTQQNQGSYLTDLRIWSTIINIARHDCKQVKFRVYIEEDGVVIEVINGNEISI